MNAAERSCHHRGMVKLIAFAFALSACGKGAPTCEEIADRLGKRIASLASAEGRSEVLQDCAAEEWSGDLRGCVADATDWKTISACVTKFPIEAKSHGNSKEKIAKVTVEKYANEAFPQWSMQHPDKGCPDKIDDLNEYMNNRDTKDPWGNPYKLMCGQNLPPGARIIAVLSLGSDGREGTADDIKSWD